MANRQNNFRGLNQFVWSAQADIALPDNTCRAIADNATAAQQTKVDQDTSLIFAHSGARAVRFISDWISLHKHDLHRQDGLIRHDQVRHFSCHDISLKGTTTIA